MAPQHRLQNATLDARHATLHAHDATLDAHPRRTEILTARRPAPRLRRVLELLLEAADYAATTSDDRWEFAVEIQELHQLGLSRNDLRWLVRMKLVEHAREVTILGDDGRQFRATGDLTFTATSCFVLTPSGVVEARQCFDAGSQNGGPPPSRAFAATSLRSRNECRPVWDSEKRELSLSGQIVKRFKWPALNQEIVLAAFAEEGWRVRIDDPLPPQPAQDSKRRLSDTIKCLNRKQKNRLLHFRGDGTGEGVFWERVEQGDCNGNHNGNQG